MRRPLQHILLALALITRRAAPSSSPSPSHPLSQYAVPHPAGATVSRITIRQDVEKSYSTRSRPRVCVKYQWQYQCHTSPPIFACVTLRHLLSTGARYLPIRLSWTMYTIVLLPSIGARYRCWSQSTSGFQDFSAPLMVVLSNTHHPSTKMTPGYSYGHLDHGFGPTDRYTPARRSMSIYTVSLIFKFLRDDFGISVLGVGRFDTAAGVDGLTNPISVEHLRVSPCTLHLSSQPLPPLLC